MESGSVLDNAAGIWKYVRSTGVYACGKHTAEKCSLCKRRDQPLLEVELRSVYNASAHKTAFVCFRCVTRVGGLQTTSDMALARQAYRHHVNETYLRHLIVPLRTHMADHVQRVEMLRKFMEIITACDRTVPPRLLRGVYQYVSKHGQ